MRTHDPLVRPLARWMHCELFVVALACCGSASLSSVARADNPIVQTIYTCDPAPMVYDGRVYVYTGHDEDNTVNNFFTMNEWRVYSSADMVNWTDHGSPLSYKDFSWAKGDAWAGQCIPRNGKFYYYVPMTQTRGGMAIGVAVSNSPTGPFKDALGHPLVSTGTGDIDPTVYIDDDGQAYLYWGNPNLWFVKLNEDMTSYAGQPTQISLTTAGFGVRKNTDRATSYEEGPWFYKRGSLYYMLFAANGIPEQIAYSTATGATGPWTYRGVIMAPEGASFTNHPGLIDFKGHTYFFYHNGALPGGSGYHRSVSIEPITYNADGTFPTITMTKTGPSSADNFSPYYTTEGETMAWESGVETEVCSEGGMDVTSINDGDYIKVSAVDFGTGAVSFEARVASGSSGGTIELRLDTKNGTLVGTCTVTGTGGMQTWSTTTCAVSGANGVHDLYLTFTGGSGDLFNLNSWKFTPRDPLPAPDAGMADAGGTDAGGGQGGSTGSGGASSTSAGASGSGLAIGPSSGSGGTTAGGAGIVGTGGAPASLGGAGGTGGAAHAGRGGCQCSAAGGGSHDLVAIGVGLAPLFRRRRVHRADRTRSPSRGRGATASSALGVSARGHGSQ